MNHKIKNFEQVMSGDRNREIALTLVEAALSAIDTRSVVHASVTLVNDTLTINETPFDLTQFERIHLFGFGKAALDAVLAIEEVLGDRIHGGAVIDVREGETKRVKSYKGTHPRPTLENIAAVEDMLDMTRGMTEKDLVLTVVSGGGSALLCSSAHECLDGIILYDTFVQNGGSIQELNTLRKHISTIKGGSFAAAVYPATVVGLIFCDVPGDHFDEVASGPTYKDSTTVDDAKALLTKYGIPHQFKFVETPKDEKFFERVHNFGIVSNTNALTAMKSAAESLGLTARIISNELFTAMPETLGAFMTHAPEADVIIAGGEPKLEVTVAPGVGSGGRNIYLAAAAMPMLNENQLMVSFASDGIDNCPMAGAIMDHAVAESMHGAFTDYHAFMSRFDTLRLLEPFNCLIETGPTGSNVSDIMFLLNKK